MTAPFSQAYVGKPCRNRLVHCHALSLSRDGPGKDAKIRNMGGMMKHDAGE